MLEIVAYDRPLLSCSGVEYMYMSRRFRSREKFRHSSIVGKRATPFRIEFPLLALPFGVRERTLSKSSNTVELSAL